MRWKEKREGEFRVKWKEGRGEMSEVEGRERGETSEVEERERGETSEVGGRGERQVRWREGTG